MSEQGAALSARYLRFAEDEARGRSPLYESLSRHIAADPDAIAFLLTLPREKQQPNLLLASVRHLYGPITDWPNFRQRLLDNPGPIRSVMLTRATQTNEPARCATLLPVLALLPQPLAIIEVGASAGLCLLLDRYGYDYGSRQIQPEHAGPHPVFTCAASRATPLPATMPLIAWRAGLDLNPLDPADPSQAAWLQTLVWPEQTPRLANLQAALSIAAADKPRILKADLLGDGLDRLCDEAPRNATLVIFHTAVLAYVTDRAAREAFAARAASLCDYWIANETPRAFPQIASRAGTMPAPGRFLLSVNASPVAWTDPHGGAIDWIADVVPHPVRRDTDAGRQTTEPPSWPAPSWPAAPEVIR